MSVYVRACGFKVLFVGVVYRTVSRKSMFELKESYLKYYDPFYYQYTKTDQSQVMYYNVSFSHLSLSLCVSLPLSLPHSSLSLSFSLSLLGRRCLEEEGKS